MSGLAMHEKGLRWTPIHNVYLQIAMEIGIPALIVFLLLLWRILKNMRLIQKLSSRNKEEYEFTLLARGFEASLIGFAVAAIFYPVAYNFYFYYPAGYAVALKKIYTLSASYNLSLIHI